MTATAPVRRPRPADALAAITSPDMADRLALAAWQHDYPGRTLTTAAARQLYNTHYAPLGAALLAVLRATADRTNP